MQRFTIALAALLLAACGASTGGTPDTTSAAPATPAESAPAVTVAAPSMPTEAATGDGPLEAGGSVEEVDLVTYVAAIEDALVGTSYEGQALDAPDVFLATSLLFCDQLDEGMSADQVLTSYAETLTGGAVDDASDDDLAMVGSLLGVGVVTLCPEHLDTVDAST